MADPSTDFIDSDVMKGHFAAAGITDEPASADTTADTTGAPDGTDTATTTEGTPTPATKEGADADSGTAKSGQGATPQDRSGSAKDGAGEPGKGAQGAGQKLSGPKDLTLADGTVVKGGQERRWFDSMQVARQQASAANDKLVSAQRDLQTARDQIEVHRQSLAAIGATNPESAATAMRLMNDLTRDPVGVVTSLLAELKEKGYSIEGIGGAVDTQAIRMMLARQQGEGQQRQQGPTPEQISESARTETGQFFSRYPDAVIHDAVLADIITKHPDVNLDTAYFQLKQAVIDQGLDWYSSLPEQVQARATRAGNGSGAPAQGTAQAQQPMVNGRGADASVINPLNPTVQPEGETFDDIIRAAMRETNYIPR